MPFDLGHVPRLPEPPGIDPFTPDEARRFLAAVGGDRLYALGVSLIMLRLRRSEACGLHWSDVELDARTLHVERGLQRIDGERGFRRVRLHDMRHTCVTPLLSLGVRPRVVLEIVGHSAMDMTMNVYGHVSLDTQRQALDALNAELDPIVSEE